MRLNHVQQRLIRELLAYAHQKYPEVGLRTIIEGPENPDHLWIIPTGIHWDDDDDRVMDFMEYMAMKQEEILVEYGYHFSFMPISLPGDNGDRNKAVDAQFAYLTASVA